MANTASVISKPIALEVEDDAFILGVQHDANDQLALYRMRLGEIRANTVNDAFFVPMLIDKYGAIEAFKTFVGAYAAQSADLTSLVTRFYAAAALKLDKTYTTRFYKYSTSSVSTGDKLDDNANLVCTPSTRATAGQDDYANTPLFMCFDCNYTIDAETLEPVIHAIKGVAGSFDKNSNTQLVGVIQMTGWVKRTLEETTKTVSYRAIATPGYEPLPEAVRASDNSVRPFVIHAKYAAGLDANGLLTSKSGVQPATSRSTSEGSKSISYSGQRTLWRTRGTQYGGSCLCELAFYQLMLELKYATLSSRSVLAGCNSYDVSGTATVAEEDVRRIIVSNADAAKFLVTSRVSIGTGTDRSAAACYSICDIATILSITDYDENNKAITLDAKTDFTTTAGCKIVSQPWATGACDDVLGNDGSPFSNSSNKEPYALQGIELQLGMYECLGDTGLKANGTDGYEVYSFRTCAARPASSLSTATGVVHVGKVPNAKTSAGWDYNKELNWAENSQEAYMIAQEFGGSSSTGYGSSTYREAATATGEREWLALGYLSNGSYCGLSAARLSSGLSIANWSIGARASGTGGNRGEYTAA